MASKHNVPECRVIIVLDVVCRILEIKGVQGDLITQRTCVLFWGPLLAALLSGCAAQKTVDQKIFRVTGQNTTNYYRVTISSSSRNGKAYFKAGLYPDYAVDMFTGQMSELPTELVETESAMRRMVAAAQTNALAKYLTATNDVMKAKAAAALLNAQEVVISQGGSKFMNTTNSWPEYYTSTAMEFNPVKGLVDHSSNKKFVVALSSDPDEILGQISAFVEEAKTTEAVRDAITAQLGAVPGAEELQLKERLLRNLVASLRGGLSAEPPTQAGELLELISSLKSKLGAAIVAQ